MNTSILTTIKKMLGIDSTSTDFDIDIMANINSVFSTLKQLGVGPDILFQITGSSEIWSAFTTDNDLLSHVITYIYLKVKSVFDPPTSSAVLEGMNKVIAETEWRLNITVEEGTYIPDDIPEEE